MIFQVHVYVEEGIFQHGKQFSMKMSNIHKTVHWKDSNSSVWPVWVLLETVKSLFNFLTVTFPY